MSSQIDQNSATPIVENVEVFPRTKYHFSCSVQVEAVLQGWLWHTIELLVAMKAPRGPTRRQAMAVMPQLTPEDGWVEIFGDFVTNGNTEAVSISASSDPGVNFVFREPELIQIRNNGQWRKQADERIDQIRKVDIHISVSISSLFHPTKVQIKLKQDKHDFAFGSAVDASRIYGEKPMDKLYQKFFFKHFNWATITNAMKWRFMEPKKGLLYTDRVDQAIDRLISNRVKVRGHCVTWGKEVKVVTWLKDESPEGVAAAVQRRINNLTDLYSGNISHWDICNEQLHGDWYEQKIQEVRFVDGIFRAMHERDGSAALCTNDYDVCSKGSYTAAYKRQAEQLKARGVPLHVMGIQSHMSERVDIDLIAKRLNKLSEAGVPLFITEMDVREDDIKKRTESYENLLRLYFSHPAVEGIILWGFWDGTLRFPEAAIATGGSSIEWNEAGQRIASLWEDEWRTEETLLTTQREQSFGVRGFYGDYSLELWYDGVHQWSQTFVLQKGRAVAVNVKV